MSKIERELTKKTQIEDMGEDEDRQEYLKRLCEAVNGLDEGDWAALSEASKAWANGATRSVKGGKDIADFDEEAKPAKAAAKAAAKPAAKTAKPAKAAAKEEEAEEAEAEEEVEDEGEEAAPKKAPAKTKPKPGGLSAVAFVRQYVATHPTEAVADIEDAVGKAGYTTLSKSSIGTIRSDFRSIARIIKDLGMLKKGVDLGV